MTNQDAHDLCVKHGTSDEDKRALAEDQYIRAFVAGMKWWEYESRKATAWPADVDKAEAAAKVKFESLQPNKKV